MSRKPSGDLRRGWTTGACATAATKAALDALWGDGFARDVTITLPKGETPIFPLAHATTGKDWAEVGITKDAGDDPDVTHGALIIARVTQNTTGIVFKAGEGVGTITKPGLPLNVGEPAINPVPRQLMTEVINKQATKYGKAPTVDITISIPNGAEIALKTWNGRLGIVGGLSILGTTGIVRPFSCAAWIASIHRGVDVARANNFPHVAGCTGATSERVVQDLHGLTEYAMLDMGDFSGGLLKYIAKNPVPRLTIGGGIGKMVKLAQGAVDLHSSRSQVDFDALNAWCDTDISDANTALEAVERAGDALAQRVAQEARLKVIESLKGADTVVDTVVIDRAGRIFGTGRMTGLILAGTYEARVICENLAKHTVPAIASLAGATRKPETLAIETRVGGFGGVDGFRAYLKDSQIDWVVDATHPFALEMTKTAAFVCKDLNIPHVIVQRPQWQAQNGDDWHFVEDVQALSDIIPTGSVVFLGTGRQVLPQYTNMTGRQLLCRVVDEPTTAFPFEGGEYLVGRPPFSVQEEVTLFERRGIDWLVVKNSGGSGGVSKLIAARQLGLPVAMLNRAPLPQATVVPDIDQAMNWIQEQLA